MRTAFIFSIFLFAFLTTGAIGAEKKAWTLLFFISGDEEAIDAWSRVPIRKLEQLGSDKDHWIVAHTDFYWDEKGTEFISEPARRYLIEKHPGPFDGHDFSTLAIQSPEIWRSEAETDSAARANLGAFLQWAIPRYPAEHYALFVLGHSWGWRGVGEDVNPGAMLPENPGGPVVDYSMASLAEMKNAVSSIFSKERPLDLLVLDACNDGVLEIAYEFRDLARVYAASPTEMTFNSFDYTRSLSRKYRTPQELAKFLVLDAIPTYGRGGFQAIEEGDYPALAITAVDLQKLKTYWKTWKEFVEHLRDSNFASLFLGQKSGDWMDNSWNVDLSELFAELSLKSDKAQVRSLASHLQRAWYADAAPAWDEQWLILDTSGGDAVHLRVRGDELQEEALALKQTRESFDFMNPELKSLPKEVSFSGKLPDRWVDFRFAWASDRLRIRPYLPGGTEVFLSVVKGAKTLRQWKREHPTGAFVRGEYPLESPYIANGHTLGAGRIHGLSLNLDEVADLTLAAHHHYSEGSWVKGRDLYRALSFSRDLGWDQILYARSPARLPNRPPYHNRLTHLRAKHH